MNDLNFWFKQPFVGVLEAAYLLAQQSIPERLSHSVNETDYPPKVTAMIRLITERTGSVVRVPYKKRSRSPPSTSISNSELLELARELGITEGQPSSGKWPWGDYETDLLRLLAAAAEKHWRLYDPNDASTAPKNATVVAWLKDRGVADRNAQVMATILRADGLPTGPRT